MAFTAELGTRDSMPGNIALGMLGGTSPYFDGCYFDPLYFDASVCGGPITPGGGHPGRTGRRGRPIVERNPVVDDDELFSGVI